MKGRGSLFVLAGCLLLSGCGGGSGTGGAVVGGGGGVATAGMFTLEGQVTDPQILAAGDEGGNVYGITGNITSATMRDPEPTDAEGEIVFYETNSAGKVIMAMGPDGTGLRQICVAPGAVNQIHTEPTGSYLYFQANNAIYRVSVRGGTPTLILSDVESFALTPSGSVIVAERNSSNQIVKCTSSGGSVQILSTPATEQIVLSCPSESYAVLWQGTDINSLVLTAGSTPAFRFGSGPNPAYYVNQAASGGLFVRMDGSVADKYNYNMAYVSAPGEEQDWDRNSTDNVRKFVYLAASPQGTAFIGREYLAASQISLISPSFEVIRELHEGANAGPMNWTRPVAARAFVGAGTSYPTGVGAMLFAEVGTTVPSVVFADAVTRASISLTPVSQQGSSNVIYRIEGDNLNKLAYTKTNGYVINTVISAASGLKGALVSFDAATGKVTTVVTYTKKPTVNRTAAGYEISGEGIADVIDGSGAKKPSVGRLVIPH